MSEEFRGLSSETNQILTMRRRIGWFWRLWLFWMCFCMLLAGGAIFVVLHFIAKFW